MVPVRLRGRRGALIFQRMTVRRRLTLLGAALLGGTLFYFGSFAFDYGAPFRKHDPLRGDGQCRGSIRRASRR